MLEVFNLFNTTNILGTTNVNYSGFSNVLVRDSDNPGAPGLPAVEQLRPAGDDGRRRLRLGRPARDAAGGASHVLSRVTIAATSEHGRRRRLRHARRALGTWAATAMVVTGRRRRIFLTPATMMRTLGSLGARSVWAVMGTLSVAGALCYAELATRFPKAGGGYVFLREAFGARCAFVYGWMALLVMDPGITAALGIGLAQYLLAALGGSPALRPVVAVAAIVVFGLLTLAGHRRERALLRWTAAAKLAIVPCSSSALSRHA